MSLSGLLIFGWRKRSLKSTWLGENIFPNTKKTLFCLLLRGADSAQRFLADESHEDDGPVEAKDMIWSYFDTHVQRGGKMEGSDLWKYDLCLLYSIIIIIYVTIIILQEPPKGLVFLVSCLKTLRTWTTQKINWGLGLLSRYQVACFSRLGLLAEEWDRASSYSGQKWGLERPNC